MTKAEQLAKDEFPFVYKDKNYKITCDVNTKARYKRRGFIKGYNLRDQTVQSDMVKFAEWISNEYINTGQGYLHRSQWQDPQKHGYYAKPNSDFYTTTDLLKIFNEING